MRPRGGLQLSDPRAACFLSGTGGGTGQPFQDRAADGGETQNRSDRVFPSTLRALAQGKDRVGEALMAERTRPGPGVPPLGLAVGPNQERVWVVIPDSLPMPLSGRTSQGTTVVWFH